jgi:hypothetical protein
MNFSHSTRKEVILWEKTIATLHGIPRAGLCRSLALKEPAVCIRPRGKLRNGPKRLSAISAEAKSGFRTVMVAGVTPTPFPQAMIHTHHATSGTRIV